MVSSLSCILICHSSVIRFHFDSPSASRLISSWSIRSWFSFSWMVCEGAESGLSQRAVAVVEERDGEGLTSVNVSSFCVFCPCDL